MSTPLSVEQHLTPEAFLAMLEERPDGERWELIEGVAYLNPSPIDWHQQIVANLIQQLMNLKTAREATWSIMPGLSTRVPASPGSLPMPDVFVMEGPLSGAHTTSDALIMVEVLSRSNRPGNQAWRRQVYASIPNCQHYVTIGMKKADVVRYDRIRQWKGERLGGLDAVLQLPAIEASLPLRDIYRWTPFE